MLDLPSLLRRVEEAKGPDRELDADLHEAFGGCAHREQEYYCIEDGNDTDSGFTCKRCGVDMYGRRTDVKPLTGSLDACLSLAERVLPGTLPCVAKRYDGDWLASIADSGNDRFLKAPGPTPALALLAAIIKAKIAQEESANV